MIPRKGDWKCLDCGKLNYNSNKECFKCKKSRSEIGKNLTTAEIIDNGGGE
jgi:hypothetical protein